ncbi:hypothetical protein D9M70_647930 [compost metagenome]
MLDQQGGVVDVGDPQLVALNPSRHFGWDGRAGLVEPVRLLLAAELPTQERAHVLVGFGFQVAKALTVEVVRGPTAIG